MERRLKAMTADTLIYIAVMAGVTYAVRMLPFVIFDCTISHGFGFGQDDFRFIK